MGAGTLMAACIGAMHYTGMMAMHGIGKELIMRFEPLQFGLFIVLAVAAGVYGNIHLLFSRK